jgi:chemotaxis protein CheD
MRKIFSKKFNREMVVIQPGEFHASNHSSIISTVLGSCIAVCLIDRVNKIGGMNHFMLPGNVEKQPFYSDDVSGKYGINAMDLLIGSLQKIGGERRYMVAKVFGGGSVINFRSTDGNVPKQNIEFTWNFLRMEGIKVISDNVGGKCGRKVLFFPDTGKVLMKKIEISGQEKLFQEEEKYKVRIFRDKNRQSDLTLF